MPRKKSERYTIRCTTEQLQALKTAAEGEFLPLNNWILRRAFKEDTAPAKIGECPIQQDTDTP